MDYVQTNPEVEKKVCLDKVDQAIYDGLNDEEKQKSKLRKKLPVVVPYYTQIFIGKGQNHELEQNLVQQF